MLSHNSELHPQRPQRRLDGIVARLRPGTQRLIKTLPPKPRLPCDLRHATGLRNIAQRGEEYVRIRVLHSRGQVLRNDLLIVEIEVAIAKRQSAKTFELRAATRLARLWRDQDKRTEARDLLAPVYGWFSEGFDTPVLQDAKSLLDQLA